MLRVYAIVVLLLCSNFLKAQDGSGTLRQKQLFSTLSDKFQLSSTNFDLVFSRQPGDTVLIYFTAWPVMAGVITEKVPRQGNDLSMNIRLINFSNALLSITRTFDSYNKAVYQGLIVHPDYADAFLVKTHESGSVELVKKQLDKILVE